MCLRGKKRLKSPSAIRLRNPMSIVAQKNAQELSVVVPLHVDLNRIRARVKRVFKKIAKDLDEAKPVAQAIHVPVQGGFAQGGLNIASLFHLLPRLTPDLRQRTGRRLRGNRRRRENADVLEQPRQIRLSHLRAPRQI